MFFSLSNHRDSGQAAIFFFFSFIFVVPSCKVEQFRRQQRCLDCFVWKENTSHLGRPADVADEYTVSTPWGGKLRMPVTTREIRSPSYTLEECRSMWPSPDFATSPPTHQKKKIHGIFSRHWGRFQSFQSLEGVGVLWRFSLEMFTDFRLVTWSKLLVPDSVLYPLGSWSIDNVNPGRDSQDEVEGHEGRFVQGMNRWMYRCLMMSVDLMVK